MSVEDDISNPEWIARAKAAISRLEVIRDFFLEGRDAEAVKLIREEAPIENRRILGVNSSHMVSAGSPVQIVCRPQMAFKIDRFAVDADVAPWFLIQDIRVATSSLFLNSENIAGNLFSSNIDIDYDQDTDGFWNIKIGKTLEEWIGVRIDFPICKPGHDLIVNVVNVGGQARMFRAAFFGNIIPWNPLLE